MKSLVCLALLAVSVAASAEIVYNGRRSFPQFRDISGFSGGTFGVDANGAVGPRGAMAISTPIGFALGHRRLVAGTSSLSRDSFFELPNLGRNSQTFSSDSSGQIVAGIDTPVGRFNYTFFILSSLLDNTANVQWQLPLKSERLGISVGAQNVWRKTGQAAEEHNPYRSENARSIFAAGTVEVAPGAYATLGIGEFRFDGAFGSVCCNLGPKSKAVVEYDTFGWNFGVGYSLGRIRGLSRYTPNSDVSVFAGMINGERALLTVNVAF